MMNWQLLLLSYLGLFLNHITAPIVRGDDGDLFPLECKQCASRSAYCTGQTMICHCKWKKTYFINKQGKHSCVDKPGEVEGCKLFIRHLSSKTVINYFHLATGILGEIHHKGFSSNIVRGCNITSGMYWSQYFQWKELFDDGRRNHTDFSTEVKNKMPVLRFKGEKSSYSGLLIKLFFVCEVIRPCIVFKIIGKMDSSTLDITTNSNSTGMVTMVPGVTQPIKKQKPSWLVGVIVGISILVLLVIVITCLVCYYRKKQKGERKPVNIKMKKNKKEHAAQNKALLSTGGMSSVLGSNSDIEINPINEHGEDDSVYLDPDIVFESKKKFNDTNYDYPYLDHSKEKKKTKTASTDSAGYVDISQSNVSDRHYDNPHVTPCPERRKSSAGYVDISQSDVSDRHYDNPHVTPCRESRKSIGYALLDGTPGKVITSSPSEYQVLMFQKKNPKDKDGEDQQSPPPESPKYFELDEDEVKIKLKQDKPDPKYAELAEIVLHDDELEGDI